MPLGYGCGITSMDDINKLFALGVEKVIINSRALVDLNLVTEASNIYGNQSIVVAVDVQKNLFGKYKIFSHSKIDHNQGDLLDYLKSAQNAGAGEIFINSVDHDGMMKGYDLNLIEKLSKELTVPMVICGGAGELIHLKEAVSKGASGVAAGSLFIYHGPHNAVLINYPQYKKLKQLFK